jgi:GxxExxY protein
MTLDVKGLAQTIWDELGPGYSERVYHNCMEVLLRKNGIPYESERIIPICFEGHTVGNLRADIIVNSELVLEFKAVAKLTDAAETQACQYLKLLGLNRACLINFGKELEVKNVTLL